jgi:hypothetical protein
MTFLMEEILRMPAVYEGTVAISLGQGIARVSILMCGEVT